MTVGDGRRVIEAGDSGLLLTFFPCRPFDVATNERVVTIGAALRSLDLRGVYDVVPTYHSVAVHYDPFLADLEQLKHVLATVTGVATDFQTPRTLEVPVVYGGESGPDLSAVAAFARCDTDTVIARHTSLAYRVFMVGFLPGFPYMARVDSSIAAPRRPSPRLRVHAGSVGIAGEQTGIYPIASPGGWQIIGRTAMTLFDPHSRRPALFAPGDTVRFVRDEAGADRAARVGDEVRSPNAVPAMTILKPGLLTTVQDIGRFGHQHLGVPTAGALDPIAHRNANRLVGNPEKAATLEATLVGPEIRFEQSVRIAVAGGDLSPEVNGVPMTPDAGVTCRPGSVLRFGPRTVGGRAYLAVAGGIDVSPVLGSRATHVQSGMGGIGRPLKAGDTLGVGTEAASAPRSEPIRVHFASALASGGTRLRVMRGPQADYFEDEAFTRLQRARFIVSSESNRMGYRLAGPRIPVGRTGEMISDATFTGALQVPPSGEPILLMADRQTTGGYPQIAIVISADIPLAAQLLPGDWIEFDLCTHTDAIAALRFRARDRDR